MIERVLDPTNYQLTPFAIPTFLTAAFAIFVGLMVLFRERGSLTGILFSLLTFFIFIWFFSVSWMYCSLEKGLSLWWSRMVYTGVPFIPAAIFHIATILLGTYKELKKFVLTAWLISALFSASVFGTDFLIKDIVQYWWGPYTIYGWLGSPFIAFFSVIFVLGIYYLLRDYYKTDPDSIQKRRVRIFLIAVFTAIFASVDILPNYHIPIYPFGYIPIFISLLFLSFVIWRYRLVDITPAFAADEIINTMTDALFVLDHDNVVRLANDAAGHLFSSTKQNLIDKPIADLMEDKKFLNQLESLTTKERTRNYEMTYRPKRSGNLILNVSVSSMKDKFGNPLAFIFVLRDITAQKQTGNSLAKSEERFRSLAESAPFGFSIMDPRGKFNYFNPKFTGIFGYTLKNTPNENALFEKVYPDKIYRSGIISTWKANRINNESTGGETPVISSMRTKNGEEKIISSRAVRLKDKNYLFTYEDITETKKLETQLQHAQKMESIGTIATGVAHNFRNIMGAILVNSQLINMKFEKNPDLQQMSERIIQAVKKGSLFVNRLLQFSRKQKMTTFESFDLAELIRETYNLITKSFDKKIDTRIEIPKTLPMVGDQLLLSQVLFNLCTNSRDAMPDGGQLKIAARIRRHMAEVIISDSGHGMDKETRERCFDPFFTTKDVDKGTGLGLSTAYGIIRQHDGDIRVYSEPEKGTVFKIYLPLNLGREREPEMIVSDIKRGKGEKVLIVDDEVETLKPIEDLLGTLNYRARSASSGTDAIMVYEEWHPDVVLMDRSMPKMDGIICSEKILEFDPHAKIVIVSGYDEEGVNGLDQKTKAFIKGYITKPLDIEELSNMLAKVFGR